MSAFKTGHLPDGTRVTTLGSLVLTFAESMDSNHINEVASLILTAHDKVSGRSKAESKIWSETIAHLAGMGLISKETENQRYPSTKLSFCDLALHLIELTLPQQPFPLKSLSEIVRWSFGSEESVLHAELVKNMRQQDGSSFLVAATATTLPDNTIALYFARLTISNASATPAGSWNDVDVSPKEGLVNVNELIILTTFFEA